MRKASIRKDSGHKVKKIEQIYKPLFEVGKESRLISEKQLELLYSFLPGFCQSMDPKMIYNNTVHGNYFLTSRQIVQDYDG